MRKAAVIGMVLMLVLAYAVSASAGCLTVNSPNGGESWVLGSVHNITWTNTCNKSVKIVLRKGSVKIGNIITNIPVSQTSYSWTVGTYQGGTAVTGTDYKILIKTMDGSSMDASNGNFSITSGSPGQCAPLSITSQNTLTDGFVNQSYNYQIQTSGGQAPVTFQKVSGSLPPGLNLSSTGKISGSPTKVGTYTFTVRAEDSCTPWHQTVQKEFTLSVKIKMVLPKPLKPFKPIVIKCAGKTATIVGTPGDDFINGTAGDDVIVGLGGNDIINGGGGNDIICGGGGDDKLLGGEGNDSLYGSSGHDALAGGNGNDYLSGGAGGDDICYGGAGNDTILGDCEYNQPVF